MLHDLQGAVLASDAFFPFSWNDSVELACKAGVAAIVHPGGSLRDQVGPSVRDQTLQAAGGQAAVGRDGPGLMWDPQRK